MARSWSSTAYSTRYCRGRCCGNNARYYTGGAHMDKPTVLIVNPNTSEAMTVAIDRIAWEAAGTSANIVTRHSLQGPHTIEGPLDAALGGAGMLGGGGASPYS